MIARLVLLAAILSAPSAAAFDDPYDSLPDGPGREEVGAYCSACHSLNLVTQQGDTRQGWADLLQWMYDDQGMAPLSADEETLVLDYLAEHFGRDSQKDRLQERGILR